jgi:NADH dehydrogenase
MLKKHVVIVGGGWAGISLVRSLKNIDSNKIRITLVSNEPNFRYSAALYRVATGHKEREALIPIHELLSDLPNVEFIKSTAHDIDPSLKTITLHGGKILHFDYAVLALGSITSYFGIPGLEEKSYSIKSQKELRKLRTHLHQELLKEHQPDSNYVIVGAGPTGVELAAAMASYLKVVMKRHGIKRNHLNIELIEAAPRVLPMSSQAASDKALAQLKKLGIKVMLNSKVQHENNNSLTVDGRSIPTHTVIWTAGVANNPFFKRHGKLFKLNQRGKVIVDDHLKTHKDIYVIGDNAVTPYSGLGVTAVHNAQYVAKDIKRRINHHSKTPPYKSLKPPTAVPVGKSFAIFEYKNIVIGGKIGGLIRSLADLVAYADIAGFKKALGFWSHSKDLEETCELCKTKLAQEYYSNSGATQPY